MGKVRRLKYVSRNPTHGRRQKRPFFSNHAQVDIGSPPSADAARSGAAPSHLFLGQFLHHGRLSTRIHEPVNTRDAQIRRGRILCSAHAQGTPFGHSRSHLESGSGLRLSHLSWLHDECRRADDVAKF